MKNLIIVVLLMSLNAMAVEDCHFKDSTKFSDIEEYKPKLSETDVIGIAERTIHKKKINLPNDWCQDINLAEKDTKPTWKVSYSGNELDVCFFVVIDDKTKKSYIEYC